VLHADSQMQCQVPNALRDSLPACSIKDESRRNRLENEAKLFQQKLALVQETRLEKREIERAIVDQRLCDRRAALERKEEVRRALEQGSTARAKEEERKRQHAKATYEERVQQEMRARLEIEAKLSDMAHIELNLIDQLRGRMEEQQQVPPHLRNASLSHSSNENASLNQINAGLITSTVCRAIENMPS
jgi:hypothetical protein